MTISSAPRPGSIARLNSCSNSPAAASIAAAALPEAFSGVPPAAPAPRGVPSPGGGIPPCCSSDLVNAPDPRAARGSSGPQSWEKARCPCVGSRPWRRAEVRPRILKNERTNHSSASVELNQKLLQTGCTARSTAGDSVPKRPTPLVVTHVCSKQMPVPFYRATQPRCPGFPAPLSSPGVVVVVWCAPLPCSYSDQQAAEFVAAGVYNKRRHLLGPATGKQGAVGHERRHRLFAYAWCLYARDRSTDTCPLSSSCPAPLPSFLLYTPCDPPSPL